MERKPIRSHEELEIYQLSFEAAMKIFEMTNMYDQIIGKAVTMINNPHPWILNNRK